MAFIAKTDKIVIIERQFRILVIMFDVMYGCCLPLPSVPFAPFAHISIAAEDSCPLCLPCSACIKIFHKINFGCVATLEPYAAT